MNFFELGLDKNAANYVPLSPMSFLRRAAEVYPDRPSLLHGARRYTWSETYPRGGGLASALRRGGGGVGDRVAVVAPNIPAMFEAHYGIPMTGAVINALNTRLDAGSIAFMLQHGETKVLLTDGELSATVGKALQMMERRPLVIDIDDVLGSVGGERLGELEYE